MEIKGKAGVKERREKGRERKREREREGEKHLCRISKRKSILQITFHS